MSNSQALPADQAATPALTLTHERKHTLYTDRYQPHAASSEANRYPDIPLLPARVNQLYESNCLIPPRDPWHEQQMTSLLAPFAKPLKKPKQNVVEFCTRMIELEALCLDPVLSAPPTAGDIVATICEAIQRRDLLYGSLHKKYLQFKTALIISLYTEEFVDYFYLHAENAIIQPDETIKQFHRRHRALYWLINPDTHFEYYEQSSFQFVSHAKLVPGHLEKPYHLYRYDPNLGTVVWIPLRELFVIYSANHLDELPHSELIARCTRPIDIEFFFQTSIRKDKPTKSVLQSQSSGHNGNHSQLDRKRKPKGNHHPTPSNTKLNKSSPPTVVCSNCKIKGHSDENCYRLHPEKKPKMTQTAAGRLNHMATYPLSVTRNGTYHESTVPLETLSNTDQLLLSCTELLSTDLQVALRFPEIRVFGGGELVYQDINALVDTGASGNFISERLVTKLKLKPERLPIPSKINFGDGSSTEVTHSCKTSIKTEVFHISQHFMIMKKLAPTDLILGQVFLRQHGKYYNVETQYWDTSSLLNGETPEVKYENNYKSYLRYSQLNLIEEVTDPQLDDQLQKIVNNHADLFKESLDESTAIDSRGDEDIVLEAKTDVSPPTPYQSRIRAVWQQTMKDNVARLLKARVIERSKSPYLTPVLMVKKPLGGTRMVLDFRNINDLLKRYNSDIPNISEILNKLEGCNYFTTLDLTEAFHQLPLTVESRKFTAFSFNGIKYQYRTLPFGLTSASNYMQEFLAKALENLKAFNYIDDVIIYSKTKDEHYKILEDIFQVFAQKRIYVKKSKCRWMQNSVTFLGYLISNEGISIQDSTREHLRTRETKLSTPKQMKSFLGFMTYFRHFIKDFAAKMYRLNEFANKKIKYLDELEDDVKVMISDLINSQFLTIPKSTDPKVNYIVETDASDYGIGAVVKQFIPGETTEKIVYFYSRLLHQAERNYPIREKELLAIFYALHKAQYYAFGHPIIIRTDHRSLLQLLSGNHPPENSRVIRWLTWLAEFDIVIQYIPGESNIIADELSRNPSKLLDPLSLFAEFHARYVEHYTLGLHLLIDEVATLTVDSIPTAEEIKESVQKDPRLMKIYNTLKEHPDRNKFTTKNFRIFENELQGRTPLYPWRPCLGSELATKLLRTIHEKTHYSPQRLIAAVVGSYSIYQLYRKSLQVANNCDPCVRNLNIQHKRTEQQASDVPKAPWDSISIDLVGDFPEVEFEGAMVNCVLTVVDNFSKFVIYLPMHKTYTSNQVFNLLVEKVFYVYTQPLRIRLDNDVHWKNDYGTRFAREYGIRWSFSVPHYAPSNGTAETYNNQLLTMLRKIQFEFPAEWATNCSRVASILNDLPNPDYDNLSARQRMSGNDRPLGPIPRLTDSNFVLINASSRLNYDDTTRALRSFVAEQLTYIKAGVESKVNANITRTDMFKVNDEVLLERQALFPNETYAKLQPIYVGPFRIVSPLHEHSYELDIPTDDPRANRRFNHRMLKAYSVTDWAGPPRFPLHVDQLSAYAHNIRSIVGYSPTFEKVHVDFSNDVPGHCLEVSLQQLQNCGISLARYKALVTLYNTQATKHKINLIPVSPEVEASRLPRSLQRRSHRLPGLALLQRHKR